jgi:DNA-binding CsgD family transcriptional regulator
VGAVRSKDAKSRLADRIGTVSSDRPEEMRSQVLEAMLAHIPSDMGLFVNCGIDSQGKKYYMGPAVEGPDRELVTWVGTFGRGPALEAPWLPPHTDPAIIDNFVRVSAFYPSHRLRDYEVNATVFEPMEIGDQLRAIIYDGDRLVGNVGLARRGSQERFRKEEEQSLQRCLPQIKAVLATADTLEAQLYGEGVLGLLDARGNIEYATSAFARWLTEDRRLYLRRRLGMIDLGTTTCGTETFLGTEVRIVRMEGASGSRYFVTVERVRSLRLTARVWLSDRQIAVAEYAAAGATVDEIARALGISSHTVKTHLKTVYERLGVASRVELAEVLSQSPFQST